MLLMPQAVLAASDAPFADLFARFLGPASGQVLAAFVIVSGLGALNGWTLILGELTVSFARHGGFPQWLGGVNARGAPTRALVFTGLLASVMMVMSYNDSMAGAFTFLSVVVTAANLPIYIGCALAVIVLWRRGGIPHPGPRELRWIVAALIAAVYCVWVSIGIGAKPLLWAVVLSAVGIPVYGTYWWLAHVRRTPLASVPSEQSP
jgi:APA family basic amino acid/polyamine antiporter